MKPLEKHIKTDARVLRTRTVSDKLLITFQTEDGDQLHGNIPLNPFETTVTAGDMVVIEYFQTEDNELVKISGITVKPRQRGVLIEYNKRQLPDFDSKRFRIRRNDNIQPGGSGYRCLFTDAAADGCIVRTFYLLHDNSLVIRDAAGGTLKAYNSAREYIETHQSALKAARRYDAIRLLEDQLNRTG